MACLDLGWAWRECGGVTFTLPCAAVLERRREERAIASFLGLSFVLFIYNIIWWLFQHIARQRI